MLVIMNVLVEYFMFGFLEVIVSVSQYNRLN